MWNTKNNVEIMENTNTEHHLINLGNKIMKWRKQNTMMKGTNLKNIKRHRKDHTLWKYNEW